MSEEKKENLVKKVCKKLGVTQKELSELLDIQPSAVSNWANNGQMPKMAQIVLEQMVEIKELKSKLEKIKIANEVINSL